MHCVPPMCRINKYVFNIRMCTINKYVCNINFKGEIELSKLKNDFKRYCKV